jgi:hypothetical protein
MLNLLMLSNALAKFVNAYKSAFLKIIYLIVLRRFKVKLLNNAMLDSFMERIKSYHSFKQEALPSIKWSSLLFYSKQ